MRRFARVYSLSLIAVALTTLLAAAMHAQEKGVSDYIHSPLLSVQIWIVLAFIITIPVSLIMVLVVAIQKRWKEVLCFLGCAFLPFGTYHMAAVINPALFTYG